MPINIIEHLFEFWEHIALSGQFLNKENEYTYTNPINKSWPSKIFRINTNELDFEDFKVKIKNETIPNSIGIIENENTERLLTEHNFKQTSIVKGMFLDTNKRKSKDDFQSIKQVKSDENEKDFARVASGSFGYEILPKTIISIVNKSKKIKLYLSKCKGEYVNCGMIYLDKNGISGIHMIGTLPKYRGLGFGKVMTNKLLFEAENNLSKQVVLVASESGERIYSKLGFIVDGALKSYAIKK